MSFYHSTSHDNPLYSLLYLNQMSSHSTLLSTLFESDGGYHVPIAHAGLASLLDMKTYEREEYKDFFLQSCRSKIEVTDIIHDNVSMKKSRINNSINTTDIVHNNDDKIVTHHKNEKSESDTENININEYENIDINKIKNDNKNDNKNNYENKDKRINNDKAYYLFHYPNLCINRYGQWMDTNIVYPIGPDKCIVEFEWYVEEDMIGNIEKEEEEEVMKKNLFIDECINDSEIVQFEDIHLCERVQRGLNSTGYRGREGRYAPKMEAGKSPT